MILEKKILEDLVLLDKAPKLMVILIDDDMTEPTKEVADYLKEFGVVLETKKEMPFDEYEKILEEFGLIDDDVVRFRTYRAYPKGTNTDLIE